MQAGAECRILGRLSTHILGTINIEREAELSGSIHTKGFYILGGLLRHLLKTRHPLFLGFGRFRAELWRNRRRLRVGAEIRCLLIALTGVPLRQDIAMTGAIDQVGNIQPVGTVTEKAEGFFETCRDIGLTGTWLSGTVAPSCLPPSRPASVKC